MLQALIKYSSTYSHMTLRVGTGIESAICKIRLMLSELVGRFLTLLLDVAKDSPTDVFRCQVSTM